MTDLAQAAGREITEGALIIRLEWAEGAAPGNEHIFRSDDPKSRYSRGYVTPSPWENSKWMAVAWHSTTRDCIEYFSTKDSAKKWLEEIVRENPNGN